MQPELGPVCRSITTMTKGKWIGTGAGVVLIILTIVLWRRHGNDASSDAASGPTSAAKLTAGASSVGREIKQAPDPRKLARGSISGTVRDQAKAPIAGARVCLDGSATELDHEELRDRICLPTDAQLSYKADNLFAAHYSVVAVAKTYRPESFHPNAHRSRTRRSASKPRSGAGTAARTTSAMRRASSACIGCRQAATS